jgi:diadenosine tetraphosphate (Ap4A) HIT family hydrolase
MTSCGQARESREACPLCARIAAGEAVAESSDGLAVAIRDAYPVAEGHTLVIPRRHEPDLVGLTGVEAASLWALVQEVARSVLAETGADGLNVGVNAGTAAGQTVMHVHVHVIPRRHGDVPDPRGGVRWVLHQHAVYWEHE